MTGPTILIGAVFSFKTSPGPPSNCTIRRHSALDTETRKHNTANFYQNAKPHRTELGPYGASRCQLVAFPMPLGLKYLDILGPRRHSLHTQFALWGHIMHCFYGWGIWHVDRKRMIRTVRSTTQTYWRDSRRIYAHFEARDNGEDVIITCAGRMAHSSYKKGGLLRPLLWVSSHLQVTCNLSRLGEGARIAPCENLAITPKPIILFFLILYLGGSSMPA